MRTTPSAFRKYCLVIERNLNGKCRCTDDWILSTSLVPLYPIIEQPTIDHEAASILSSLILSYSPLTWTVFTVKSTPMVALNRGRNRLWQNRWRKQVFPTAESPTKTTLNIRSGVRISWDRMKERWGMGNRVYQFRGNSSIIPSRWSIMCIIQLLQWRRDWFNLRWFIPYICQWLSFLDCPIISTQIRKKWTEFTMLMKKLMNEMNNRWISDLDDTGTRLVKHFSKWGTILYSIRIRIGPEWRISKWGNEIQMNTQGNWNENQNVSPPFLL